MTSHHTEQGREKEGKAGKESGEGRREGEGGGAMTSHHTEQGREKERKAGREGGEKGKGNEKEGKEGRERKGRESGGGQLFSYPGFGVEFDGFLSELEVEGAVAAAVVCDGAEDVLCAHFLPFGDDGAGEVAIDGDVASVADEDVACACELEDAGDDAVEDGASSGTRSADEVRAFVVELYVLHAWNIVDSEAAAQHVLPCDGYRQASLVLFEGAVELAVFGCEPAC